jgi:hypothetical protein
LIALFSGAAAWPLVARAQHAKKIFQVGVLYPGLQAAMASRVAAIQSGLRAGGLRTEQFQILPRTTDGNPALPQPNGLAGLLQRNISMRPLTATGQKRGLASIRSADPVGSGYITSLAPCSSSPRLRQIRAPHTWRANGHYNQLATDPVHR